jgi:YHS domain-containing protein
MDIVIGFLKLLIVYFLFKSFFDILAFSRRRLKIKSNDLQANNKNVDKPQVEEKEAVNMVVDRICGRVVQRSESYIIVKDGIEHYFCSWACREKFVNT